MTNLHERLDRLRHAARRAMLVRGLSWVVAFGFAAMLVSGWVDWIWHVEGNLRLALGLATLAGVGWLSWRMLIRPLLHALSNVELAIKIERRFPQFRDSLASTVQFQTEHTDPRLGSPELQQRVIDQTMPQLDSVDLDAVIEQRGVRQAASTAFAVSLLMLVIVAFNQNVAATAVRRMLFPYSAQEWDRETNLRLLDEKLETIRHEPGQPFRRVQGDTFRVYVENLKGELPEDTILEVKDADGALRREKLRRLTVRDKRGAVHRLGTANLLLERGPMHFRASGGDDRAMAWHRLEVVPAPRVESIQVTLVPPAYSGRKEESLPAGVGHIRALVGTEVNVEVTSHTPLQFARLRVKSDSPRKVKLSPDGLKFQASFRLAEHGNYSYWFELKDRQGFDNPNAPRYDIRAIRDRLPTVRVVRPPRNARVTKKAVVPVQVIAEDDLALRHVLIRYRSSLDREGVLNAIPLSDHTKPYRWQVKQIENIIEGMQIRFHVEATDDFNLDKNGLRDMKKMPKHVGKSLTRMITIVTEAEKTDEIARNYGSLLEELSRIAKQQQQAHDDVTQLHLQLANARQLRADRDLPVLRRAERAQREINVRLSDAGGVEQRAKGLVEELRDNQISQTVLERRLMQIVTELGELRLHHLPKIEADLTITRKNADDELFDPQPGDRKSRPVDPAQQQARLQAVQRGQMFVLNSLNALIADLREWRNWQNLGNDLDDLVKTQEALHRKSLILNASTFGLETAELQDQQKADLVKLAEGQRRFAERVERFHKDIRGFIAAAEKDGNQSASTIRTLTEAAEFVREQQFSIRIGETSRQIDANKLGLATAAQEKLIGALRDIKAILENRGASDLETLIKQQKAAERELAGLEKRQEELVKQAEAASQETDANQRGAELKKLVKQQEELRRDLNQMTSRLRRLLAIRANDAARRAAQSMSRAAKSLQGENLERNREEQRETLAHLEQARRELAKTRAQAEEQLARELLERIAGELAGIVKREQNVIDETVRLHEEFVKAGKWSRGRSITLETIKDEQLALHAKMQNLAQKTRAAEVFSRVLRSIGESMQSAARDLAASRQTPVLLEKAIEQERGIKDRLVKLLATLASPAGQPKNGAAPPAGAKGGRQPQTDMVSLITKWKLLKSLQEDTLKQTKKLHSGRKGGAPPSDAQKKAIEALANEQSQLLDLAGSLAPKATRAIPDTTGKDTPRINRQNEPPVAPDAVQTGSGQITIDKLKKNKPGDIKRDNPQPGQSESIAELHRRITAGMRSAVGKITAGDTGETTQKAQRQVIADIEELIRQAEKQLSQRTSTAGTPKRNPANAAKQKTAKAPKPNRKTGSNSNDPKKTSPKDKPSRGQKKDPKGSDESIRKAEQARMKTRAEQRDALIRERWGDLPEGEKLRLRNVAGDKSLPKYKPQNDRYFESLAED